MKLKIKSLRVEKKLTYNDRAEDYDDNLIYVLNCVEYNKSWEGNYYEIILWTEYGDCCSGWCPASWGIGKINKVNMFSGMTHRPKDELVFELDIDLELFEDMQNNIFSLDKDGGDCWYPCGSASVNMFLFEEINRNKKKRPVWIFKGDSASGKSYLSTLILNGNNEKSIYETDAHEVLCRISEDIIVLGNKYDYTVEDIEEFIIGEHETILVDFKIV